MTDAARVVENLIYQYAELIDRGDLQGVGRLFANGRIEAAPGVSYEGAEAVQRLYEATTRLHGDGTPRTQHVTTNVAVAVDGETATARSRYTVFQQTDDLPLQAIIAGRYEDSFHVVARSWCFDTRVIHVDLTGELGHHLNIDL